MVRQLSYQYFIFEPTFSISSDGCNQDCTPTNIAPHDKFKMTRCSLVIIFCAGIVLLTLGFLVSGFWWHVYNSIVLKVSDCWLLVDFILFRTLEVTYYSFYFLEIAAVKWIRFADIRYVVKE